MTAMRKIATKHRIITMLIVSRLIFTVTAFAFSEGTIYDINLASFSHTQLLELRERLASEFASRGIDDSTLLTMGSYVAGVDIAPGTYILHVYNEKEEPILVFVAEEGTKPALFFGSDYEEQRNHLIYPPSEVYQSGEIRFTVDEGQILYIIPAFQSSINYSGILSIEKSKGLFMD